MYRYKYEIKFANNSPLKTLGDTNCNMINNINDYNMFADDVLNNTHRPVREATIRGHRVLFCAHMGGNVYFIDRLHILRSLYDDVADTLFTCRLHPMMRIVLFSDDNMTSRNFVELLVVVVD